MVDFSAIAAQGLNVEDLTAASQTLVREYDGVGTAGAHAITVLPHDAFQGLQPKPPSESCERINPHMSVDKKGTRNAYSTREIKISLELQKLAAEGVVELTYGRDGIGQLKTISAIRSLQWANVIDRLNASINSPNKPGTPSENLTQCLRDCGVLPRRKPGKQNCNWRSPEGGIWEFSQKAMINRHCRLARQYARGKISPSDSNKSREKETITFKVPLQTFSELTTSLSTLGTLDTLGSVVPLDHRSPSPRFARRQSPFLGAGSLVAMAHGSASPCQPPAPIPSAFLSEPRPADTVFAAQVLAGMNAARSGSVSSLDQASGLAVFSPECGTLADEVHPVEAEIEERKRDCESGRHKRRASVSAAEALEGEGCKRQKTASDTTQSTDYADPMQIEPAFHTAAPEAELLNREPKDLSRGIESKKASHGGQPCEHAKRKSRCERCSPQNFCKHGRCRRSDSRCKSCLLELQAMPSVATWLAPRPLKASHPKPGISSPNGRSSPKPKPQIEIKCEHGRAKSYCPTCVPHKFCVHNRRKERCKECGGSQVCEHGRLRRTCKACGGSAFCEHGREKCRCKLCGGSQICAHNRNKHRCRLCNADRLCRHGFVPRFCTKCKSVRMRPSSVSSVEQ